MNRHYREADRYIERAEEVINAGKRHGWSDQKQADFDRYMDRAEAALDRGDEVAGRDRLIGPMSSRGFMNEGGSMSNGSVQVGKDWSGRSRFAEFLRGQRTEAEFRAGVQSVGSSGQGGVLVPSEFQDRVFEISRSFDGLRMTRTTIEVTDHGRELSLPAIDDTGNTASIVSEGSTIAGTTGLSFTAVESKPVTYRSGPILASWELLDDSAVDIVGMLERKMGERIGRATASHFATRSSTNTEGPHGVTSVSTGAVTMTAGTTNLTLETLRSLYFAVDPSWRTRAEWIMSDDALEATVALNDADGRPLVHAGARENVPGTLFGKRIHVVADLPSINSSSAMPIMFGAMDSYMIRDVRQLRLLRLDERYAEQGRVGFIAFSRHDGRALFSSTFAPARRPIRGLLTTT